MILWLFIINNLLLADSEGQLWLESSLRAKIAKKLRLEWSQHLRFDHNISSFQSVMPEIELRYKPIKMISIKLGYRYIYEKNKNDRFDPAHRYHIQLSTNKKIGMAKLSYRIRYQEKHEEDEFDYTSRLRNKLSIQLDTGSKYEPVLFTESFTDIASSTVDISKYRIGLGVAYAFRKKMNLRLDYIFQREDRKDRIHLLRIKYRMNIKRKKGK